MFLAIRRLFTADDAAKSKLDAESLLLLIRHLVQKADEQSTFLSHSTLSSQLRCSESTIANRTAKLKRLGIFAVKSGKRSNSPNEVTVMLNKLPQGDLKAVAVSSAAKEVATAYKDTLHRINPKHRFQAGTLQRWEYVMQSLLVKCGGSAALLVNVLNFALHNAKYTKEAQRGPDRIKKHWRSLFTEYSAAQEATK
ncbi:MAG TPA: hypothetical protein VN911_00195 [Candidatus Acidoferrum sp.]|nr:hypothetical protein [Candidatus Acidoferrum sp.]